MPIPSRVEYAISASLALALLAGCSGGAAGNVAPSAAAPQSSQSVSVLRPDVAVLRSNHAATAFVNKDIDAKSGGASVIVSDASNNVVDIFNEAGKQLAQLTGFSQPQGLGLDSAGNLYVADTNNS